ncbi:filamentous hemagglutinin N-terminal domain-containing protein [Massilia sp. 9I]|uniref:two-partner secretion domain-containing protein n=1 Tax=Massilia sp. 9I TaxID=2653152 RepID=UPI0012F2CA9C|nr:filamentous hemagglutinin N-terminal domain-containing protein [Massilia sp. 9I]VXC73000.1 Filamentous hemagglutinin family N-terminal domain-containing protein [Massilia sp. 9I]
MRNGLIRFKTAALCVAACFGAGLNAAQAAPTLPKVVAGQATFSQDGNVFSITNTPGTIINWQSFSVNAGEITRFIQQSSDSAVLNRIVGQDPSRILGALQSNGKVFLINPNGVIFGQNARVDVNGLVASTLNMSDADFLAGKKNFTAGPNAGSVRNEGAITTPNGGKVFLVAPNVENTGIISAPNGDVVLAAGRSVQLVDSSNPDLTVVVSAPTDQAINLGQVVASGGRIGIYGALVNQRGVVNANSAVVGQDGKIVLKASKEAALEHGSITSATGAGKGGDVQLLGERVALSGNAQVDASGVTGGGTVLVGGDYQGKNAALPNAQQTSFGKDASIRADATTSGNGGKVVLWSDGATAAGGSISARGAGAGNGGLVETSGRQLGLDGIRVDAAGGKGGRTGTWLIDPTNIEVSAGGSATDTTYITAATLTGTNADIVLQATKNIDIKQDITTSHNVRAEAGDVLTVAAAVTSTAGNIDLRANNRINLAAGSLLSSPNYIDLKSNRMTLTGSIGGVNSVLPVISFNPFDNDRGILLRGTAPDWALGLDPQRLGSFGAYEINIGSSAHNGLISIDQELRMAGNLVIDTRNSININAPVTLTGANSQFVGTLHESFGSGASVTTSGVLTANKISILGADQTQISGEIKGADIAITAASGGIQIRRNPYDTEGTSLSTRIEASKSLSLRAEGELYQESGTLVKAPSLVVEGNSVEMLGVNQVGTLAGRATGDEEQKGMSFHWTGALKVGTVDGVSGLQSAHGLTLVGGGLTADANIEASKTLEIDAASIGGSGIFRADTLRLNSRGGIGSTTSALRTSTSTLSAVNTASGAAPINILNDRILVVDDAVQAGEANAGAISIETSGGLTVSETTGEKQGVHTGSGNIRLVTHSPLTIEGRVTTESGNVTLVAADNGPLTIRGGGLVKSTSGSVSLTGGTVRYPVGSVQVSDLSKLSSTETKPETKPDPTPPLDSCISNPNTSGCGGVLEQAKRDCIATPDTAQCRAVLPQPQTCRDDPTKLGCGAVLVRECIATPKAPGCGAILPTYEACSAAPATYGCAPVIAERQAIDACIANPKGPGCASTLPQYQVCASAPTTYGCAPVIAERQALDACIANPKGAGCASTLPQYEVCASAPTTYGCAPVIAERRALDACIANPKAPGCGATLPQYEVCASAPATYGCAPVIAERDAITACIKNPTAGGCGETLPPLATCRANAGIYGCVPVIERAEFLACVANPTAGGCAARLPALSVCKVSPGQEGCAQVIQVTFNACLVNPNDASCTGILPTLSQCVNNKTTAGCQVVLPTLQQCIGSPTLQGCSVQLPKLEQCAVNPNTEGCVAVLPKPDFCSTHPSDPTCQIFNPNPGSGGGDAKRPVSEAQQAVVTLVNTAKPATKSGAPDGGGASGGGGGSADGGKPADKSENQAGPAAGTNSGVKNEKPATKMYCN